MSAVIGQTGRSVLSEFIEHKVSHKRTVRYRIKRVKHGFLAEVIGPFHSALYGVCSFGVKQKQARKALARRLGNDYRYFGNMMLSAVDDVENIGRVDSRVRKDWIPGTPITLTTHDLVGCAGQ